MFFLWVRENTSYFIIRLIIMKNKSIKWILLSTIINAQGYTLNDCIDIAIGGKRTILSAELGVVSASKGLRASYSGLLPSVQAATGTGRTFFPPTETISLDFDNYELDTIKTDHYNSYSAGFTLNQTLYDGGRSWNQVQQAKTNLEIARLNQRLIHIQVMQKVIESYYGLLKAQKLLDVSDKNLEMSNQQLSLVKKQFELGVVKRTDLLKAEVAIGQARVDMLNKKTSLQNARRILFNDMGLQDFGQQITVVENDWIMPNIPSSSGILNLLKNQNPSLLISKAQVGLNDLSYKLIRGLRLPSMNTSMNYSANGESTNQLLDAFKDNWSFGLNLSISLPIYNGSTLSIQQQQADLSRQQSEYSYITLLNDLRVQAELIRETLNNYSEIIPLNQSVVTSAEEDLKLARERYSLGSTTILEVLDAQVSLIRSNSTLINTVHDARIQEASLKGLLGTLDMEYKQNEK
jgi:outer membrane protein